MRQTTAALAAMTLLMAAVAAEAFGQARLLDGFEGPSINWTGQYQGAIVSEYATQGEKAFKVVFSKGEQYPGIEAARIDLDWSGYDALRIDIYNPQGRPVNLNVRIDDPLSGPAWSSRYNGDFLVVNGQTFLEIPFADIRAGDRLIDVSRVARFLIFMASPERDTVLYFDNIRVTRGDESPATRGRVFAVEEASRETLELREKAVKARVDLKALIDIARSKGHPTLEPNIALITAELGIDVRPQLPWYRGREDELYHYVIESCRAASEALRETLDGRRRPAGVPPVHDTAMLEFDGPRLVEKLNMSPGRPRPPVLLFSMLYHRTGPLVNYFAPNDFIVHSHAFAGASRYDVERTPLWQAYRTHPETHRVWNDDEGWCGHIVRDLSSLGGAREPVVVCLESPRTREAIAEYTRAKTASYRDNPRILLNIMGGELSYICYCDYSLAMFRAYLAETHGSVERLNSVWGAGYASFGDVTVMPNARQAGENRARWFDWQSFNCKRFVDHAAWARSNVHAVLPGMPVAAGAVSYSFRSAFGRSGVDEEQLIRRVDDVVLNEAHASTISTDLLYSLSEGAMPMFDFEYHGDVAGVLPHFLHGNTAIAMWWWPDKVDTEFPAFNETALPYSWNIPLSDVAEALKIGLDVRRLSPEIAAFPSATAQIAILYSRASMLQVEPEFLGLTDSPYTMELKNVYDGALALDAPVRFISSLQVREGKLSGCRLLVVPGAKYVFDDVAEAILKFAEDGGTVVIAPDSFLFDEYARPVAHLSRLGVSVIESSAPWFSARGGERRHEFLQEFVRKAAALDLPPLTISAAPSDLFPSGAVLKGMGVRQNVEHAASARVLATLDDGAPALLEIPRGKGRIFYLTAALVPESYNALLDAAAARAQIPRPARFSVNGLRDWQVEGRAVDAPGRTLFYVTNRADETRTVRVTLGALPREVTDLRDPWRAVDLEAIEVPARRTRIFAAERPLR